MSTKLEQAIEAIKAGDKVTGKELLAEVIKIDRSNEQAWLWLTQTDITRDQKIKSFKHVLRINPNNETAKRGLEKLQPSAKTFHKSQSSSRTIQSPKKKKKKSAVPVLIVLILFACTFVYALSSDSSNEAVTPPQEPLYYVWVSGFESCPTHPDFGKQVTNRANTYKADGSPRFVYIPHGTRIGVLAEYPDEAMYKIRWNGEITYIQTLMTQPQDPAQGVVPKPEDCLF